MAREVALNHLHDLDIQEDYSKTIFGFWVYIMTDCILFGTLFVTYAVLHTSTFGGPSGREIFDLRTVLIETFLLLTSSFTSGIGMLYGWRGRVKGVVFWFIITFLLGAGFVAMEIREFAGLIHEGHGPDASAFLSSFFTLVGTHGTHVSIGLLWMAVLIPQIAFRGMTSITLKRLTTLSIFWHFLDIVWIFIFTIVYLMGVIK